MPRCLGSPGSVRATRIANRALCAPEVHTFCPLTTQSSPSRTARVPSAGQVGAGARLAEELAPDLLAGPQRTQEAPLLLVGAVGQDRRRGHAEPDADALGVVVGCARLREGAVHLELPGRRQTQPAEAVREVHPGQSGVVTGAQELQPLGRGRIMRGEELLDRPGQFVDCHRAS